MNNEQSVQEVETTVYEAPQIESVLTPEELEREVAYAGVISISGPSLAA